ncbi:MAG TPA: DNA mismatch repair endonuclease MutL [Prolixibacteraceae bacterium]|nr:DNA mismatch repair endonuclease MutL [Prolixibacteraceae bacterium]HPR85409.1 DNA mismatch repair endonuclease MutL [Prolixibacteraceae bacterium]
MADIIQLLPDSVANQIAAGEVIQRPASVVKELVENAIDAGATQIKVIIKDAGRTLIQIIDNGCGMSDTDARMSFERHATSKIRSANDIFAIRTMGFRGEALASIAAIADVELRTREHDKELGTFIHISGSEMIKQEAVSCDAGTNFQIKNLFFNVPARRKFLKSNPAELKHIINEIQRITLANPEISLSLHHNGSVIYDLTGSNKRVRIVSIFGKQINQNLVPIDTETTLAKISGFVGQPKYSRKTFGEQFFFVNKRFMKHPFFHKAIMQAYEKILPPDSVPSYFIYFDLNPADIDVNIHPTKTEIKFENESAIWQILQASVREALGKFNVVPSIDFDQAGSIDIPMPLHHFDDITIPEIKVDPTYNPFETKSSAKNYGGNSGGFTSTPTEKTNLTNWQSLYKGLESDFEAKTEPMQDIQPVQVKMDEQQNTRTSIQFKNKYILTPVKSGLMVIDQKRAHERILYERLIQVLENQEIASQQQLFPETFELNAADATLLTSILPDLRALGFDIREFGKNSFIINGTPGVLNTSTPVEIIEYLLEEYKNSPVNLQEKARETVAASLAQASAIPYGQALKANEISELIDNLFACQTPNFSPKGKKVLSIMPLDDFEKILK